MDVSSQISLHTVKSKLPKSEQYFKYPPLGTDGHRTEYWMDLMSKQENLFYQLWQQVFSF